ncbi:M23 family metallopeptidase [Pseudovibrio sp. Tun.PSC04-5.I4]|uniref:M23 family metallopeptidase n=1 Tax=Pseudovibrio sp. Tun.PSC04-5.I4 TaxID=1798213 RepID=UPI00088073C7|nr:M23 family metallopeptidase [Pseudovibrio sp. Tun.PSC04-5.I4]SDQ33710.1 Peptidase family M23 [Pseudovibrio sp. Tun.PSC04-5.I4]
MMRLIYLCLALTFSFAVQAEESSRFMAPGDLIEGTGEGIVSKAIFFPNMRFPVESGPAYAKSHAYAPGGFKGGGGSECDEANYSYPWRDNFCEFRRADLPVCASGGHQGQDIRPASCEASKHWAVAADNGIVAHVGRFAVTIQTASGTLYRYVHLDMDTLQVKPMDKIAKGSRIGKVSNNWLTKLPIHLHFDAKDTVLLDGQAKSVFLPPYSSLVASYQLIMD